MMPHELLPQKGFHKPLDKKTAGPQPTRANGADDSKSESASSHSHSQTRVAGLETLFDGTPMPVNTETALVATQHLQLLQTTIKTQADAFAEYKEASQSEMKRKNEELARKDVNSQKYVDGLEAQTNLPAGMNAVLNVCVKMSKEITANPADQDSIVCKYRNTWLQYRGLATKEFAEAEKKESTKENKEHVFDSHRYDARIVAEKDELTETWLLRPTNESFECARGLMARVTHKVMFQAGEDMTTKNPLEYALENGQVRPAARQNRSYTQWPVPKPRKPRASTKPPGAKGKKRTEAPARDNPRNTKKAKTAGLGLEES